MIRFSMANTQSIKSRIKSIKSTIKVTKVMQTISTGRFKLLRKSLDASEKFFLYSHESLKAPLWHVTHAETQEDQAVIPNFLKQHKSENKSDQILIVAIGSNRGLCGGLNSVIAKQIYNFINASSKNKITILCCGQKIYHETERVTSKINGIELIHVPTKDDMGSIHNTATKIYQEIIKINPDQLLFGYTDFISSMIQETKTTDILLLGDVALFGNEQHYRNINADTGHQDIVKIAINNFVFGSIYYTLHKTALSEQAMRMRITDNATNNGKKAINSLILKYNKIRQTNITNEIIDIISATNAAQ